MKRWTWLVVILILLLGFTLPATASAQYACYQPTRLVVGGQGRVTLFPNLPNTLRTSTSIYATAIGSIPSGSVFNVLAGPVCNEGWNWWQVNYNGVTGWTSEGDGGATYWLEPISYVPPPPPPAACPLPNRLVVGGAGQVTRGAPNNIRSGPGVTFPRVGQIPGGGIFSVISGPQCDSYGRWWWQVNYNGITGWTAEGGRYIYWVEPVNVPPPPGKACWMQTRLVVGGYGRVTPGLPNVLRSAPGTTASGANSVVIGSIPGGAVFQVNSGPTCGTDGRWWWYVNYNGLLGWTAEGENGNYWVEPW